jgi:hypothetical protein
MTKQDLLSELAKISLDLSKIYGQNIQIEVNCNMDYKTAKIKISEYITHQYGHDSNGDSNGVNCGSRK